MSANQSAGVARPVFRFDPEAIPEWLKAEGRFAPWEPVWDAKREKWGKIPFTPGGYGLSTARPERWVPFAKAVKAAQARPSKFAGVGVLMARGIVGVDLDDCLHDGELAPWAAEIVRDLDTYTEVSPSGKGLRLILRGELPEDFVNHDVGIEVYAGHGPRFLTMTGQHLPGTPAEVADAPQERFAELHARYARRKAPGEKAAAPAASAKEVPGLPDLVGVPLPDIADLNLPASTRAFLLDGEATDRSRSLFSSTMALFSAGLDAPAVLNVLATSPHAMEVALDHRRQDPDRAIEYLWEHHVQKAQDRATPMVAGADDFEDVRTEDDARPAQVMFNILPAGEFILGEPLKWLIKNILPQADIGALYGPSGSGKTFLAMDIVIALARGLPWRGHRCKQAGVLYIAAEGMQGARRRLQAHALHYGYKLADIDLTVLAAAPNLLDAQQVDGLIASIKVRCSGSTKLIVIDTLAQTTPGANENSSEDMGRAIAACQRVARACCVMVLLVAHAGKDVERGMRGWSGIKGALDVEIMVERSGEYRAATLTKVKDGPSEGLVIPFGLSTVVLGEDEDGELITSAIVTDPSTSKTKAPPKGKNQQLVLQVLRNLVDLDGEPNEAELVEAAAAQMSEEARLVDRRRRAKEALASLESEGFVSVLGNRVSEKA